MALALVAALGRAVVPAGFMPTAKAGVLEIVICGADHAGRALLDLGGGRDAPVTQAGDHCLFAASTVAATPPPVAGSIARPAFASLDRALAQPVRDLAPGRGLAAPPPPSHAPPVLI
jgi:hypothetical protein